VGASTTKVKANRRNAALSTGPTSDDGKAIVAGNALRHGLLSWKPVLPEVEREEDWQTHLSRTLESLAPVGQVETALAERVALLFWRLNRVVRFEQKQVAMEQEDAPDTEEKAEKAKLYRGVVPLFHEFPERPDDQAVSGCEASWLVGAAAEAAGIDIYGEAFQKREPEWLGADTVLEEFEGWTAGRVREYLATMAAYRKTEPQTLWGWAVQRIEDQAEKAEEALKRAERKLDEHRRTHLIAAEEKLNLISRYEAGLERSLYKALHELERRKAGRDGQLVPPPAVVDVHGMDGAGGQN
jgi:hypothetical protein